MAIDLLAPPLPPVVQPDYLIDLDEACRQSGLCASVLYQRERAGLFPKRMHLGKSSRWSQNEVQAWIADQKAARDRAAGLTLVPGVRRKAGA
jgi:predicted DNA-binding transcriptional regulator AlpA